MAGKSMKKSRKGKIKKRKRLRREALKNATKAYYEERETEKSGEGYAGI